MVKNHVHRHHHFHENKVFFADIVSAFIPIRSVDEVHAVLANALG
jgi:hypothetical protein